MKIGISSTAKHPTQRHIVASGSQDGTITFWDLRSVKHPMTVLQGHERAVNEVMS